MTRHATCEETHKRVPTWRPLAALGRGSQWHGPLPQVLQSWVSAACLQRPAPSRGGRRRPAPQPPQPPQQQHLHGRSFPGNFPGSHFGRGSPPFRTLPLALHQHSTSFPFPCLLPTLPSPVSLLAQTLSLLSGSPAAFPPYAASHFSSAIIFVPRPPFALTAASLHPLWHAHPPPSAAVFTLAFPPAALLPSPYLRRRFAAALPPTLLRVPQRCCLLWARFLCDVLRAPQHLHCVGCTSSAIARHQAPALNIRKPIIDWSTLCILGHLLQARSGQEGLGP